MTYHNLDAARVRTFLRTIKNGSLSSNTAGLYYNVFEYTDASRAMMEQMRGEAFDTYFREENLKRFKFISIWLRLSLRFGGEQTRLFYKVGSRRDTAAIDSTKLHGDNSRWLNVYAEQASGSFPVGIPRFDWGTAHEGDSPSEGADPTVVSRPLTGWAEGYVELRPIPALLVGIPAGLAALAVRMMPQSNNTTGAPFFSETIQFTTTGNALPSGQELITAARTAYRDSIRQRLGRPFAQDNEAFEQKRREHREKTAKNFEAFVRDRKNDEEHHIGKLPFVPHGLASSRRWGIEVESGGARGVSTPTDWAGKGDGSLRSAYAGYVEVQDFEPYDEEVTERITWRECTNRDNHSPGIEVFDSGLQEYVFELNPDYVDPRTCEACGDVTRTVRREPRTIRHEERSGDCREFVSPILTSMHSNGLEALTTALSKNPQSDSAGVHVHVEANDLSKEQIATIVYGYDILEPILESSYRRNVRTYCERREVTEVLEAARKARSGGVTGAEGGRYRTLNTHSLASHGTLEFRAMGPVYEYEYLIRWAMLCRELVNSVANGAKTKDFAKIKSWDDLTAFLAMFGKEYIRAAVYEMTGEVGEAAKLEKAGEPVTNEALNLDLNNIIQGTVNVGETFRQMNTHLTRWAATFGTDMNRLAQVVPSLVEV